MQRHVLSWHACSSRKVNDEIGVKAIQNGVLSRVQIPQHSKKMKRALLQDIHILYPHVFFNRDFNKHPDAYMYHTKNPDSLCESFYSHDLVVQHGPNRVWPGRLFFDFAELDKATSTLNVFFSCVHLKLRVPFISVRKALMCKCGCRGFHTIAAVIDLLSWALGTCGSTHGPPLDPWGEEWPPDSLAAELANQELFQGTMCAVVEVCADLDEYAKTTGFPYYRLVTKTMNL